MAEYNATKKYSGRVVVSGDYSIIEGNFHANSNNDEISRQITKHGSAYADHAMQCAAEIFKKGRDNND
jgi:hypothetical protein